MKRDELLDLIREWIYKEKIIDSWFREENYRLILGRNTREKLVTSNFYWMSFEPERETLFEIPVAIDIVDAERLELVKVIRKERLY